MLDQPSRRRSAEFAARLMLVGGIAALGCVGMVTARLPAIIFPGAGKTGMVQTGICAVVIAATLIFAARPGSRIAAGALVSFLLGAFVIAVASAVAGHEGLAAWVPSAETLTLIAAILCFADQRRIALGLLVAASAVMLALFGTIHLLQPAAIASLFPEWLPRSDKVPLVSGALMLGAAVALFVPQLRAKAAILVAAMFVSWLPLIHAGRIAADSTSAFEWEFAFMALALSGALLLLGTRSAYGNHPGETSSTNTSL